jgi:16S rRNA (guanine(966)-N(2))-methyltransferase RsmD
MSRIIGGQGKGRRLKAPKGTATRPTGARVRQTLFDILAPRLPGCRFLDAFAGSGAVGLEALSRGAARVVLVDSDREAAVAIEHNVRLLAPAGPDGIRPPGANPDRSRPPGATGQVEVFRQDARLAARVLAERGFRFDVVFLDPPYESDLYVPLLEACAALLEEDGVAVAEHFHKKALPERIGRLARVREVRVGDHRLSFYGRAE